MPWYDEDEDQMPQYGDPEEDQSAIDPAAKLPLKPRRDALSSPPPPPADLSRLRDAVANPPPMPKPGMGRRILSGLAGGAAGWLNTTAGRPGGIAHPIDPTKAEENILGITGYKRKLQNWQMGTQALEKEATIAEKARQDDINARLGEARINEAGANRDALAEIRRSAEQTRRDQQKTREDTANQAFESQTYTPEELGMTQGPPPGADNEFQDFPDGSPGPPPGYMPTTSPSSYKGGPRLRPTTAQVERNKKQADIDVATQAGPAVSQEELDAFKDVGIVLPYKVGDHIPTPNYVQLQNQYRQAASAKRIADDKANVKPKPLPKGANEILGMRAEGIDPTIAMEDLPQADADKVFRRLHPPNQNNIIMPGSTEAPSETAKSMAWYELAPPVPPRQGGGAAMANYERLVSQIKAVNPAWDATNYAVHQEYKNTKGTGAGRNILSLNTISEHTDDLVKDLFALRNGDQKALNSINNWMRTQFGAAPTNNAELAINAVASEIATALKGGVPGVEDVKNWRERINTALSNGQIAGLKQTIGALVGDRLDVQAQQYFDKIGRPWPKILTPKAKRFLKSAGVDVDRLEDPSKPPAPEQGAAEQDIMEKLRKKHLSR